MCKEGDHESDESSISRMMAMAIEFVCGCSTKATIVVAHIYPRLVGLFSIIFTLYILRPK